MKTVKIIFGSYGAGSGAGVVRVVSRGETCEVDDSEAERLVSIGVASYIDAAASPVPAVSNEGTETSASMGEPENAAEGEKTASARLDPEQLKTMKNLQLKKLARDMGIDVTGLRTNAELIDAITAVDVEIDTDEDTPDLTPEDIVV